MLYRKGPWVCLRLFGLACLMSASLAQALSFDDVTDTAGPFGGGESWGASWGFLDPDIYPDLFVSNHRNPPKLFRNNGAGRFTDVTLQADVEGHWLAFPDVDTHSGSWADINNDGLQDLIVPIGGPNSPTQVFINEGGVLRERSAEYGFGRQTSGRLGVFFDYDGDASLDVLLTSRVEPMVLRNTGAGFVDVSSELGAGCARADYGFLSDLTPDQSAGIGPMQLYCAWQTAFPTGAYELPPLPYTNAPWLDITGDARDTFAQARIAKDTAAFDFNGDLRPDLFVLQSGSMRPSDAKQVGPRGVEAYFNPGRRQTLRFVADGAVTFDLDSSLGSVDHLFIGAGGFNPTSFRFTLDPNDPLTHGPISAGQFPNAIAISFDPTSRRWTLLHDTDSDRTHLNANASAPVSGVTFQGKTSGDGPSVPRLYLSDGAGFSESAAASGFGALDCLSVAAGDFDNDGDVDIYLGCRGGVENLPNRLFLNQGDGSFVEVPGAAGAAGITGFKIADGAGQTDSVVVADYDLDGNLDLFVTNGVALQPPSGGPYQLFRNRGVAGNNWIQLDLVGVTVNRDAIGARVIARTASLPDQLREHSGGYHRWSQNLNRVHFGLGQNALVDLEVIWPNGVTEHYPGVPANSLYRITEGGQIDNLLDGGVPPGTGDPCGEPAYDRASETGVFIWRDCSLPGANETWELRVTGGGSPDVLVYAGEVAGDRPLGAEPVLLQNNDVLDSVPGDDIVDFALRVKDAAQDGFRLTLPAGASACFDGYGLPSGVPVYLGADRTAMAPRFSLRDLGACTAGSLPLIEASNLSVREDAGVAGVQVRLSGAAAGPVAVDYATADGSARAGIDYVAASGTLQFAAGQTSAVIPISVIDNASFQGNRGFDVALSNPVGGLIGDARVRVTIIEDDQASSVDCGAPDLDPASDTGFYIWRDCEAAGPDRVWEGRITAGGSPTTLFYRGEFTADRVLVATPVGLQANDTLDSSPGDDNVDFVFRVRRRATDGFRLAAPLDASVCLGVQDLPQGAQVYLGAGAVPMPASFDLGSLQACGD